MMFLYSFVLKRCEKLPTVTIDEENYKKLINLAGKIQVKINKCVSINDVITRLLISEKVLLEMNIKNMEVCK